MLSLVLDSQDVDKGSLLSCLSGMCTTLTDADESIWGIYYRLYIDTTALKILNVQAKNLVAASKTLQAWNKSKYGSVFRFCDSGTFSKVAEFWARYAATNQRARHDLRAKLKKDISKSAEVKLGVLGALSTRAKRELGGLYTKYSKHGLSEANPMFESNGTLHYSLDPLSGFHLAPAYVPLTPMSMFKIAAGTDATPKVLDTARLDFVAWCSAFKKCSGNLTLRFFTGDALSFCQALQHVKQNKSNIVANCYRRQGCSETLLLDSEEYGTSGNGPLMFTVIDTSNLVDHLGALNILVATSPLLENMIQATLFTEVLARQEDTHWTR